MSKDKYTQRLLWFCITSVICGLGLLLLGTLWGFLPLILGTLMYVVGLYRIKSEPYSVGLFTVKGKRTKVVAEGYILRANYWPLYIDIEEFELRRQDFDFKIENIPCKGGGAVDGEFSFKYIMDKNRVTVFTDNKGKEGVESQIQDQTKPTVRDIAIGATGNGFTWEEMRTSGKHVSNLLWREFTGSNMPPMRQAFEPRPGINDVPNLGINLVAINATFTGIKPLEDALDEANAETKRQQQEQVRLDKQMARAQKIYDALPEAEKTKSSLGAIILRVINADAIRAGQGEVVQVTGSGNPRDAAFAEYVDNNQKRKKRK